MRILHYINDLGAGGAEKLLTDILPKMKEEHEVGLVISRSKYNFKPFVERLEKSNVEIIDLNVHLYNPIQIFKLIRLFKKWKPDVVHAHLFPTQYWLGFSSLFINKKVVLIKTEHSVFNERKNYKILALLEKFVYRRYNSIITITNQVHQNLVSWIGMEDRMHTIYNGLNLGQVKEAKPQSLSDNKFLLLMVGRFDGVCKAQDILIQALGMLPRDIFHLYFAGSGVAMDKAKTLTDQLNLNDEVTFLGLRDDVYSLMSSVDLNILSTKSEGLSGVALESLASKGAFIGSNVEGVNNIVPDERFLFEPNSPQALKDKIWELYQNQTLREEMVVTGNHYVERHDIKHMVLEYIKLYKRSTKNA